MSSGFDVSRVRRDFPILAQRVHDAPLVYFDNAASAQKPRQVLLRMEGFMTSEYANVHRGLHYLSNAATAAYEAARHGVADFINAAPEEVIFTSNATDAINLVAQSFLAPRIAAGDEIIVSLLEHHSNIVPWHFLRERQGAKLQWIEIDDAGVLDLELYAKLLAREPKLVALTHMSNALGVAPPLKKMISMAHAAGVPVLVDGAQGIVHMQADMAVLDADFYVFTGHKIYASTGIGVLYGKRAHLEAMRPYRGGGEMIKDVRTDSVSYARLPFKFEAGTPPIIEAVSLHAALDYVRACGREQTHAHETALRDYAYQTLAQMPDIILYGHVRDAGSIVSFNVRDVHAHDIATLLDQSGVAIRAGHHCAQPLMDRLGVAATARTSFSFYNDYNEVDVFIKALRKAIGFFKPAASVAGKIAS